MAPPPSTAVTPMPRPCACGESCTANRPCHCCLAAEVEALRARNETLIATIQRQDSTFERQMEEHEELEALRAQVQRVREECEYPWFFDVGEHAGETPQGLPFVETAAVLKAIDGGDE